MSMASLEKAILAELRLVSGNKKLKMADVMEWSTSKIESQKGETYYFLPELKVHCAVKE